MKPEFRIVRSTNTKYSLKRRHEAFRKTSSHYQGINVFVLINTLRLLSLLFDSGYYTPSNAQPGKVHRAIKEK